MRGFGRTFFALFQYLIDLGVPRWAIVFAIAGLLYWVVPKVIAGINKDRARRVLLASRLDSDAKRHEAETTALDIAADDPHALVIVATEAIKENRRQLAEETIERLRATGHRRRDLRRLEDELYGPLPVTAIEAVIRLEKLVDGGMLEKAEQLAGRAVRRWPGDTDLAGLLDEIRAASRPVSSTDPVAPDPLRSQSAAAST